MRSARECPENFKGSLFTLRLADHLVIDKHAGIAAQYGFLRVERADVRRLFVGKIRGNMVQRHIALHALVNVRGNDAEIFCNQPQQLLTPRRG